MDERDDYADPEPPLPWWTSDWAVLAYFIFGLIFVFVVLRWLALTVFIRAAPIGP